jgi:hypothetical protein
LRESLTVIQLYKLEHLVSNDHIPVVLECNFGPRCLMLIAFYCTKDEGVKEIRTCIESLHSQDLTFGYEQIVVRQILFSNKNQN